jgi:hypothetical protein
VPDTTHLRPRPRRPLQERRPVLGHHGAVHGGADGYRIVADPDFINEDVVARLYRVDPATIQLFRIPSLNVVKISFPRPISQGSLRDRDMHMGQHHVPLALLPVPAG